MLTTFLLPVKAVELGDKYVSNGSSVKYSCSASASYRMYAYGMLLNVTDNSTYPMKGTLKFIDKGNETQVGNLVPYIIRPESNTTSSPFVGILDANSPFITAWNSTNVVNTETFSVADDTRRSIYIVFSYTNKLSSNNNTVHSSCRYRWDMTLGIMLESEINITNVDDYSKSGWIRYTLEETSLWALSTGGIPGYPMEFTFVIAGLSMLGIWFVMKKKTIMGVH